MTYAQRKQNLEKRQNQREIENSPEAKLMAVKIVLFIVILGGILLADLSLSEMIGYMIGFTIVMLPLTLFFGTLKILK